MQEKDKQRRNRYQPDWNRTIWEAVQLAGGLTTVAEEFGLSPASVQFWFTRGYVPSQYVTRLCEMGRFRVTVGEVLAACAATKLGKADATISGMRADSVIVDELGGAQ